MKSLNSVLTASITLATALVVGPASASVEQPKYGNGIAVNPASHYDSVEVLTIGGANLGSNTGNTSLYIGSK